LSNFLTTETGPVSEHPVIFYHSLEKTEVGDGIRKSGRDRAEENIGPLSLEIHCHDSVGVDVKWGMSMIILAVLAVRRVLL
jgi:hypothetical protein